MRLHQRIRLWRGRIGRLLENSKLFLTTFKNVDSKFEGLENLLVSSGFNKDVRGFEEDRVSQALSKNK